LKIFFSNITRLNGKAPDYAGINNIALVSHHMDANTVHNLCIEGFNERAWKDVIVEEITKKSLDKEHIIFYDIVEDYFLPYDEYPNIR
jgi:hypothetical protein